MFKFLDPTLATYYKGKPFYYIAPRPGEKWAEPTMHPNPAPPDGQACGPGRLHAMLRPDARYAPLNRWPWWCRGVGQETGRDEEKVSYPGLQLRRIEPRVWWRIIRLGWCARADLREANLRRADLREADLCEADLREANLCEADLREADLRGADLRGANLEGANLRRADLERANLEGANLEGADLERANLRGAWSCQHTLWPDGFVMPEGVLKRED